MGKSRVTQKNLSSLPDGVYSIERNFYLRVRGDSRNFFLRMTVDGKRRDYAVGSAAALTLAIARGKAQRMMADIKEGKDPEKKKEPTSDFQTVALMALDNAIKTRAWKGTFNERRWRQILRDYAFPALGAVPVSKLSRAQILGIVKPLWITKRSTAELLLSRIEYTLDFAKFMGIFSGENPARWQDGLDAVLPKGKAAVIHRAAPTLTELKTFAEKAQGSPLPQDHLALACILCASRLNELRLLKWPEVSPDCTLITIPPERRKDKKTEPFLIPCSAQMSCLLSSLRRASDVPDFVFASLYHPANPVGMNAALDAVKKTCGRDATLHGCRSTFRDWCADAGKDFMVSELCLMHSVGSAVQRAYLRTNLLQRRRQLLQEWADVLLPP